MTKRKDTKAKTFVFLGTAFVLLIALLFTGCANNAGGNGDNSGGTPPTPTPKHAVTFSVEGSPANGTLKARADGIAETETSPINVEQGKTVTFTAMPETGYRVKGWTLDGVAVNGTNDSYTLSVTKAVNIKMSFEPIPPNMALRITIKGDERVNEGSSGFVDITEPKTWGEIKEQIEAKLTLTESPEYYGVYVWKLGNENGEILKDEYSFAENTTVYAVTNYKRFRMEGTVLAGCASVYSLYGRIIIPDTVTQIKKNAFKNCTNLTYVDFSDCTELTDIGESAFENCTKLTGSLNLSACTELKVIDDYAFKNCSSLTGELKLPRNITKIDHDAFESCKKLTRVDFSVCTELTYISGFEACYGLKGGLDLSACTKLAVIGGDAFSYCSQLTGELKLPPNIITIDDYAFNNCSNLTGNLDMSAYTQLSKIGYKAFYNCKGLTGNLNLSALTNLTEIGFEAFYECSGLTGNLNLAPCTKLTKIGDGAFYRCNGFTGELKLPPKITEIDENTFNGCGNLTSLDISLCKDLTVIKYRAFENCGFKGSLDLSAFTKLTKIEKEAFRWCSDFNGDLKLPPNITEIEEGAFAVCSGVTGSIVFSGNQKRIAPRIFYDCKNLTSLDFSACVDLTEIGSEAFYNCTKAEVKLPKSITQIGDWAFGWYSEYCKKVMIPNDPTQYNRIKALVKKVGYPEGQIEPY